MHSEPRSGARQCEHESRLFRYITLHVRVPVRDLVVYSARLGSKGKMAQSKVPDATLKDVEDFFLKRCTRQDSNEFSLLITGKTGVGKSSLVNALVGRRVGEEKHGIAHSTVTSYDIDIKGVKIRVWDTPGLQDDDDDDEEDEEEEDGKGNDEKYLAEMQSKIKEQLDLVIFCLKMDDTRFRRDDKETFKTLTDCFGKELWKNAVIALTFADKVDDPAGGDREAYFRQDLAKWQNKINSFLSRRIKLDPELAQSLQLVPTGYYLSLTVLPDGKKWLPKFWMACYKVAKKSSVFNLYRINKGRVKCHERKKLSVACGGSEKVPTSPGREKVAVACGGSEAAPASPVGEKLAVVCAGSEVAPISPRREKSAVVRGGSNVAPTTPGLDDSEMPPIELDKEQQESFWNATLEAFREHCLSIGVVLSVIGTVGLGVLRALIMK